MRRGELHGLKNKRYCWDKHIRPFFRAMDVKMSTLRNCRRSEATMKQKDDSRLVAIADGKNAVTAGELATTQKHLHVA